MTRGQEIRSDANILLAAIARGEITPQQVLQTKPALVVMKAREIAVTDGRPSLVFALDAVILLAGDSPALDALTYSLPDVTKQPHYTGGIEPIEYMASRFTPDQFRGWLVGNVLKYVSRFGKKDGVRDLHKAADYLARLIRHETAQETIHE